MATTRSQFIVLMALLMSLIALAIDAMLPALGVMQEDLAIANSNHVQFIISSVFLGMGFGLMLYGPLSDAWGRKKPLYIGLIIFTFGSLISIFSSSLEMMLVGRFLQGFGGAASRVVSVAMIRDNFSGTQMGKIMSLIMVIFIIVPALAPTIGQVILYFFSWKAIFGLFVILGILILGALRFRQEETLPLEKRIPFSYRALVDGCKETLINPISRSYTLASGLIFGAFVGYLSLAQQIFQVKYGLGDKFSYCFGALALCIGFSSYLNSKLVEKYGMRELTVFALGALAVISLFYLFILNMVEGSASFIFFISYLAGSFLFVGILFGNLNALAIEPLGHIAGIANSVISSVQTFISVLIGVSIGQFYTGDIHPLVISFFVLSLLSIGTIKVLIPSTK